MRVASGMQVRVLGWDMNAAFALADAMSIDRASVAVFLPDLEPVVMNALNAQTED